MYSVLERPELGGTDSEGMEDGEGKPGDLEKLEFQTKFWGPGHTFCALAPGAAEPLQSALKYFRDDFERHIRRKALCFPKAMRRTGWEPFTSTANPTKRIAKQNLLHACLSLGFDLPYFCWHAALGSVGACRQCAVKEFKDEKDTKGKIVMACMTPAKEETRISIHDPEAVAFRAAIVEGMMLNHPHDCPVCDVGGECHLQDMTVMTGHDYRRTRFEKRTFRNQYLGPFLYHEMNRCIQCYRCVRFYREYAGGNDLNVFGIKNTVYFGRSEDGVLENEFAGNLVEICPTGVFTDETLRRHYTRKWDLRMAPSICVHCAAGCNITIGERYGLLRRVLTRFNSEVNGYFLCDRGRYGYEFVNSEHRIRRARLDGQPISRR